MKSAHLLDHLGDLVLGREDRGAEVVGARALAKARAGHQHDAGGVEQLHAVQRVGFLARGSSGGDGFLCRVSDSRLCR
jgi:hypothetical protein